MHRLVCSIAALLLCASPMSASCPDGTFDCVLCSVAPVLSMGAPGLSCPTSPGGLPDPSACTKWTAPSSPLCLGVSHSCTGRYICCPEGQSGYFACNKAVLPDCTEQFYCHSFCCPDEMSGRVAPIWVMCTGPGGQVAVLEYVAVCD